MKTLITMWILIWTLFTILLYLIYERQTYINTNIVEIAEQLQIDIININK